MTLNRCSEAGWVQLACPDGRRGVWMRVTDSAVELCAGREGDDVILSLDVGSPVTERHVEDARDILSSFDYAKEVRADNK